MVTLAPTCFCTVRKFCRKVVSDTSAHVGRVAARLRISAVVATLAIIAGAPRAPRLRWGYSRHRLHKQVVILSGIVCREGPMVSLTASAPPASAQVLRGQKLWLRMTNLVSTVHPA